MSLADTRAPSAARLTEEQAAVVDCWDQGLAVLAGAGSGKTTTLVQKCREFLRRQPEGRFTAVSFTERSAADLREKMALHIGDLRPHWVMTIHGLCGTILREFPREAGLDGEEKLLSEGESEVLWARAIESLWAETLAPDVEQALERMLQRESPASLRALLKRARELRPHGMLDAATSEGADPALAQLGTLARFVLERYDRIKRRRAALDFNDLELAADRALEHEAVRRAYQERFGLVLVDEFQDTNPLQARIVFRFARPDTSNLCVVGDPKQSIYRFRDADVSVFEDCCARLPARRSLTFNFRSRPAIIEFANAVCAPAFAASSMAYEALSPKREAHPDTPPVLRVMADPAGLASWLQGEVARGAHLGDFALLLRKIRGNEKWLRALSGAGLPIAIGSGGFFWEDPRVRELVSFLRWWDEPEHSLAGAAFLRAPWVGIDDALLDRWIEIDPTWAEPFFKSGHRLARALAPHRGRPVRPGELLLKLLVSDVEEGELGAPLLGLWHRVEELSAQGLEFHAVVTELGRKVEESYREREVPPPKSEGQISVLTLHGSKGLEFDRVILLDLPERPARASNAPLLYWDRARGALLAARDDEGERIKDDPLEAEWKAEERRKELAESMRLFYVALTRAREQLVLVYPTAPASDAARESETGDLAEALEASAKAKKSKPAPDPYTQDFWRGWITAAGASVADVPEVTPAEFRLAESFAPVDGAAGAGAGARASAASEPSPPLAKTPLRPKRPRLARAVFSEAPTESASSRPAIPLQKVRHSVTEWNTLSRCPRAYEWTFVRPRPVAPGEPELGLFTGERVESFSEQELSQRDLGTEVHRCLELGDYDGLRALEAKVGADRFHAEPVISWALSTSWMAPAPVSGDPMPNREVWTELAFEAPVGSEILVGSLDRLVREEDSTGVVYRIIDFKVTERPKSVEALSEAYQAQLALYAWAVESLKPRDETARIEALLVNISARTIQAVPVPLAAEAPVALATQAREIVAGDPGAPKPGPLCRVCEFGRDCPEARRGW